MEFKSRKPVLRFAPARAGFAFVGLLPLLVAAQAQAVEFSFADDEISGSIDTTISYGQMWRVQGQDRSNNDINTNDGNRNFDTGLVSQVFKITSDLEVTYQNYGAFIRGTAFYDTQIMDKRNDYYHSNLDQPSQSYPRDNTFTYETRHKAGRDAQILDAYLYGNWDILDKPVTARIGNQVFNWGEGLFYRGGVNTTNPVDAAKFRLPGSELKEVLVPVEALSFNIGLTDNLSMETFYQFNWKESAMDPSGTYFAETDLFADGGSTAYTNLAGTALTAPQAALNGASLAQLYRSDALGLCAAQAGGLCSGGKNFVYDGDQIVHVADIGTDLNAKNDGQYGVAFRYIAEELNSTEFGFYYINYHAKEPSIYADLGSYQGVNLDDVARAMPGGLSVANVTAAGGLATLDTLANVQARREYAEDIRMMGLSFNTTINETSVFGELSYRPNLPIGIATTNDLLGDLIGQAAKLSNTGPLAALLGGLDGSAQIAGATVNLGGSIHNYERVEMYNTSLGAIHNFGPGLSFDSLFGVFELASEHIRGSNLQYLDYQGNSRYYAGRPNNSYVSGYDRDDQINKNAYGYTVVFSGTWNDVYAGVNLSPFVVYKDDFEGNSHQTGNFIEGRKAYTLGLRASYLNSLEAELQYTEFWGAGQNNSGRDRDNIGLNVKYSF
ncbi:DUF1302 domain-containing protein [Pseudomonas sp. 5P_3.1_Bac2]|uniref:DUF1302 domain-containing protein n=1 Tax=Pseudomonas sp. 5P_3.1_Bac2 TaxID=2971617 RepID=UPI0021CADF74|nr:DUF1302 domain-containing protein [Pseudomonas sp. 5P_3.1_Bac2]MCU1716046.1 DUF1302 domain-containing protein [Pseudomonas sp. 5P_3.1_Bac2]